MGTPEKASLHAILQAIARLAIKIVFGIAFITFSITIHELGHLITAKSLQIGVQEFSIGYGQKVIGYNIGETEYKISAIPLGGYVAFYDNTPDYYALPVKPKLIKYAPVLARIIISASGAVFGFITAILMLALATLLTSASTGNKSSITNANSAQHNSHNSALKTVLTALRAGLDKTAKATRALLCFFKDIFLCKASMASDLYGPAGITKLASDAKKQGLAHFISFTGQFIICLSVINILPIPPLDGGILLFYCIELIMGNPLSPAIQNKIFTVGKILLIAMFYRAMLNDFKMIKNAGTKNKRRDIKKGE